VFSVDTDAEHEAETAPTEPLCLPRYADRAGGSSDSAGSGSEELISHGSDDHREGESRYGMTPQTQPSEGGGLFSRKSLDLFGVACGGAW